MARTPAVCLIALLLLAAIPPSVSARQVVTTEEDRERLAAELKRYFGIVDLYRAGHDTAVRTILTWDAKRLDGIVAILNTAEDPIRAWPQEQLKAAAMLHTDAAMEMLYDDEVRVGFELDLAGRLLQKVGPDVHPFSRDWYANVARKLRSVVLFTVAERFLEDGRKRQPNDPVLLYESGLLHEHIATFAAFLTQVEVPIGPPPRPGGPLQTHADPRPGPGRDPSILEQRRALARADDWLTAALKLDGSNELAQLHLGRVYMLRGNQKASTLLERLARSADPSTAYLAAMFVGAMATRNARYDAAEQHYRTALSKMPSAHSAHIALSETLMRLGRGDESRSVVRALILQPADKFIDPWWLYLSDSPDDLRRRLAALRRAVRR